MHLSQHEQTYLSGQHFPEQNRSTSHQLLNPQPFANAYSTALNYF